jgi:hypothetical protein
MQDSVKIMFLFLVLAQGLHRGMLCWCFTVWNKFNLVFLWFWIVIEIINGIGPPAGGHLHASLCSGDVHVTNPIAIGNLPGKPINV